MSPTLDIPPTFFFGLFTGHAKDMQNIHNVYLSLQFFFFFFHTEEVGVKNVLKNVTVY